MGSQVEQRPGWPHPGSGSNCSDPQPPGHIPKGSQGGSALSSRTKLEKPPPLTAQTVHRVADSTRAPAEAQPWRHDRAEQWSLPAPPFPPRRSPRKEGGGLGPEARVGGAHRSLKPHWPHGAPGQSGEKGQGQGSGPGPLLGCLILSPLNLGPRCPRRHQPPNSKSPCGKGQGRGPTRTPASSFVQGAEATPYPLLRGVQDPTGTSGTCWTLAEAAQMGDVPSETLWRPHP